MKRILLTTAVIISCFIVNAQEKSEVKALEFSSRSGALIKKEFYEIGELNKGDIKFDVLMFHDVIDGKSEGLLRVTTSRYTSIGEREFSGSLNYDELDGCIQSMQYIKNNIINTTPETYTEYIYRTVDGVKIGAYWSKGKNESKWVVFIQSKTVSDDSMRTISVSDIDIVVDLLKNSKSKMEQLLNI